MVDSHGDVVPLVVVDSLVGHLCRLAAVVELQAAVAVHAQGELRGLVCNHIYIAFALLLVGVHPGLHHEVVVVVEAEGRDVELAAACEGIVGEVLPPCRLAVEGDVAVAHDVGSH